MPQASKAVSADDAALEAGTIALKANDDGQLKDGAAGETTGIRSPDIERSHRTSRELAKLVVDPVTFAREHSQRQLGGRLRTVDGRISADVAATFAAHCDADLGKISQADLVEVLIRAYLTDVGVEIRRPFT